MNRTTVNDHNLHRGLCSHHIMMTGRCVERRAVDIHINLFLMLRVNHCQRVLVLVLIIVQLAFTITGRHLSSEEYTSNITRRAWMTLLAPKGFIKDLTCLPGLVTRTAYREVGVVLK